WAVGAQVRESTPGSGGVRAGDAGLAGDAGWHPGDGRELVCLARLRRTTGGRAAWTRGVGAACWVPLGLLAAGASAAAGGASVPGSALRLAGDEQSTERAVPDLGAAAGGGSWRTTGDLAGNRGADDT